MQGKMKPEAVGISASVEAPPDSNPESNDTSLEVDHRKTSNKKAWK